MSRPRIPVPADEARRLRRLTERIASTEESLRGERATHMLRLVGEGYSVRAVADACGMSHPAALEAMAKHTLTVDVPTG